MKKVQVVLLFLAGDNQLLIVRLQGLPRIHSLVQTATGTTLTACLACLRNLSIHRANEVRPHE